VRRIDLVEIRRIVVEAGDQTIEVVLQSWLLIVETTLVVVLLLEVEQMIGVVGQSLLAPRNFVEVERSFVEVERSFVEVERSFVEG
jgi:hypothetical protein